MGAVAQGQIRRPRFTVWGGRPTLWAPPEPQRIIKPTEPKRPECANGCGGRVPNDVRGDARYCSDECRRAAKNAARKLADQQRARARAIEDGRVCVAGHPLVHGNRIRNGFAPDGSQRYSCSLCRKARRSGVKVRVLTS